MKYFTFRLPVKKYIQKYLTTLYGETIPATMDTDIGFIILNILASRLESQVARGYNKQLQAGVPGSVTFTIPIFYWYYTKKQLSVHTCILLNRFLENRFEDELCRFIAMRDTEGHGKYKKAIEDFSRIYNIELEEDITFDGLRKMEYRSRKKRAEVSLCKMSPINNLFSDTSLTA